MQMLSPSLAPSRMLAAPEMVREVPPPPAPVSSSGSRAVTAVLGGAV